MTDVSQYIRAPEKPTDERIIDLQGGYFLGEQRNLEDWAQRSDFPTVVRVKPLKANSAGNILFADYQPHDPNVFSFHDPLNDIPAGTEIGYSVIGWHAGISEDPCMDKAPDIINGKLLAQLNMVLEKTKMDQAGVTRWTTSQDPSTYLSWKHVQFVEMGPQSKNHRCQSHQDLQKLQNIAVSGTHHADIDKQTAAEESSRVLREFKQVEGGSQ
ncbi:hypothetical protein J7337_012040 [Fusarium musae]|uniref:Uncharacterized protein n=1 Tax=Fusarium musae TaxID=1042133 RepID=A0A9P8D8J7_9HYPO|nr:hypothetical protein J7337_012040 [Fusarium musae]KAG9497246.1 hypothetical protein J7337_012040 [Fusarium musae]